MSIEVLQRQFGPGFFTRLLNRIAPNGWNVNTQFFLVFIGVLGIHVLLVTVFQNSAIRPEPGDKQGYFTSESLDTANPPTGQELSQSALSEGQPEAGPFEESLALTDSQQVSPEADSEESDLPLAPVENTKSIPSPKLPAMDNATPHMAEAGDQSQTEETTGTQDKSEASQANPAPGQKLVAKPAELPADSEPRLTDLISENTDSSEKPPSDDSNRAHLPRVFRQLR